MNIANNNNQRKNENNNNNNQNNNNNINEGVEVLLNEFQNMVTAMGTGVPMMGRDIEDVDEEILEDYINLLHTDQKVVMLHLYYLFNEKNIPPV